MAQTNNTTIQLYYSSTAVTVPSASNLAFGELAINILDEKLYFKNSSGVVKLLATPAGAEGTVESVSVTTANGFAGTVATSTTFPAITLSTTITGVLKGNGTAISAAVSGTDYAPATTGTSILKGNGTGGFANAVASTDYAPATVLSDILSGNGTGGFTNVTVAAPLTFTAGTLGLGPVTSGAAMLKGDGAGGITNATAGTDYAAPTSGTSILRGNGVGGFNDVTVGTGLSFSAGTLSNTGAPATVGTSILRGNGVGGFNDVTVGTGLSFSAGTLSNTGAPATSGASILYGNNVGGFSNVTVASSLNFSSGTLSVASAPSLLSTNWTVSQLGTKLYFAYNNVNKMSIDSNGNIITVGNVTAFGTP